MPDFFKKSRNILSFVQSCIREVVLFLVVLTGIHVGKASITDNYLFSKLPGEADPQIRSILQLNDGRMAFATESGVDLFDGSRFTHLYKVTGDRYPLSAYDGFHHLYVTHDGRYLWIKNRYELQCVDLETEMFSTDIGRLLNECGVTAKVDNLFADSAGRIWIVAGNLLIQPDSKRSIRLDKDNGDLLDLASRHDKLYLFYRSGIVSAENLKTRKELYSIPAYTAEEQPKYEFTSHMVESKDGFYQIRNGNIGGFFLFDPSSQKWTKILESNLRLNTLAIADSVIFISTTTGLISINPQTYSVSHIPHLRTRTGNLLASELSSIAVDKSGGIWIGTYNRGIFYYNPYLYKHFSLAKSQDERRVSPDLESVFSEDQDGTIRLNRNGRRSKLVLPSDNNPSIKIIDDYDIATSYAGEYGSEASFVSSWGGVFFDEPDFYNIFIPNDSTPKLSSPRKPFLSGILVNAERIEPLKEYSGDVLLRKTLSQTSSIILPYNQNFITFEVTDPDYSIPDPQFFFMLEGIDPDWREASYSEIKDRMLTTSYTAIPPGDYIFRVKLASDDSYPDVSLKITILHPWWATTLAWCIYALLFISGVFAGIKTYVRHAKKRIEAEQREANLLSRIHQLIEEVDRYKSESPTTDREPEEEKRESYDGLSDEDKAFIARAMELVEQNLDTPGYSVVQLSADLCMDRTGLYRKLTMLLDRSPSLFIRDIRLRKAATLLKEGKLSVTEIAERCGFSTTSYMSKCFQERYGCKPSQFQHYSS